MGKTKRILRTENEIRDRLETKKRMRKLCHEFGQETPTEDAIVEVLEEVLNILPERRKHFYMEKIALLAAIMKKNGRALQGRDFFQLPVEEQRVRTIRKWQAVTYLWLLGNTIEELEINF